MPGTPVRYILKFTITLFLYFFSGCELTEPDRFINDKAYPPEVKSLVFDKIVDGQRISGEFTLELDPSIFVSKITSHPELTSSSEGSFTNCLPLFH